MMELYIVVPIRPECLRGDAIKGMRNKNGGIQTETFVELQLVNLLYNKPLIII